jgi:hypothetical protein
VTYGGAAEVAALGASRIDTCSASSAVDRRLGHVSAALEIASSRLDTLAGHGFNPQPDPPGGINPPEPDRDAFDAQLDSIIAQATAIAESARMLKTFPPDPCGPLMECVVNP